VSKTIRHPGGVLVRFIEAFNGFKTKFGYWPELVEAEPATISALATHCLTPLGFFLLQSKVDVVEGDRGKILAKSRRGDVFDYGDEGWQQEHEHDARAWLGLDEDEYGTATHN
jgi:hypothetical protein